MQILPIAALASTLALVGTGASDSAAEASDLNQRARTVIESNAEEYLAAVVEVQRLPDDCEPTSILCVDQVMVRKVLGQRTTDATAVKSGEHLLILGGFIREQSDLRKGSTLVMVGIPVWLHGELWAYSPLALKVNPTPQEVSEVSRAVSAITRPGV